MKNVLMLCMISSAIVLSGYAQNTKQCEFAGSFYPQDKKDLRTMIDSFIDNAKTPAMTGEAIGIVVPHAGYVYSGKVAGSGYKAIKGKSFDAVILLASAHQHSFSGIAVYPQGAFATPLGNLSVAADIVNELQKLNFVHVDSAFFSQEHPIEVELPFIIQSIGQVPIVPILFGATPQDDLKKLVSFLNQLSLKKRILIVVSTDMSHYQTYEQAKAIDHETIEFITTSNIDALWVSEEYAEGRLCGMYPLITLLLYAKEKKAQVQLLDYANSGDTVGSKDRVVGYMSLVVTTPAAGKVPKDEMTQESKEASMTEYTLSQQDKKTLLQIARSTLNTYLKDKKRPIVNADSKNLLEKRGAFVTLKKQGELRGCIGRIVGDTPVYKAVSEMAIEAATGDPRFVPVTHDELSEIEIEISVLTPFERVKNLDEIEVGTHGLMIRKGFYSGLLLPQVPTEQGWDKKTFLEQTCRKAGLPLACYLDKDSVLERFSAIVFNEADFTK